MIFKMKDICTKIGSGATPRGGKDSYINHGISLIRSQNILDFSFLHDGLTYINEEQARKLNGVTVEEDDVLLNITGDSVARVCIVDNDILPARVNQHVCIVRGDKDKILSSYILYFLQMKKQELLQMASGGATRNALTKGMIEELEIEVPSIKEQKKIISTLDSIQEKIKINNKINRNLSEQIQLLYSNYFEGIESKGWELVPLNDLIFFQEGPGIRNWQYVEDIGTKFINIRCINNGDIDVSTANMISNEEAEGKYAHFMLKSYDIVMSCSGTLGRYAIVREEHLPLCLNTSVIRFSPAVVDTDFSYVYGYMTSREFLNRQREMACGSVQANFGPTHLKRMEIHEPPMELRKQYHEVVFPLIQQMICLRRENDRLARVRDSLLPKLMSGELDVAKLDI